MAADVGGPLCYNMQCAGAVFASLWARLERARAPVGLPSNSDGGWGCGMSSYGIYNDRNRSWTLVEAPCMRTSMLGCPGHFVQRPKRVASALQAAFYHINRIYRLLQTNSGR